MIPMLDRDAPVDALPLDPINTSVIPNLPKDCAFRLSRWPIARLWELPATVRQFAAFDRLLNPGDEGVPSRRRLILDAVCAEIGVRFSSTVACTQIAYDALASAEDETINAYLVKGLALQELS